ncbi:MAG TPA: phosphorylated adapter RNA export RNA-binding domain-containing protein, partial [Anaerolineales bacterium]|nr:phosphorylated adapter RNA export RNA-binding domain-containing protein [Anaerolineales bacterium]
MSIEINQKRRKPFFCPRNRDKIELRIFETQRRTFMTSSTPSDKLVQQVANELNENNSGAMDQIRRLIETAGEDFVQEILEKTREVENKGGMFVTNEREARRRTPGGVFFHLVKENLDTEQKKVVFPSMPHKKKVTPIEVGPEASLFAHQASGKLKVDDPEHKEIFSQIAQLCGQDLARSVLEIVTDMEAQEGVRRPDGTRRSPGEAFMYIASRRMTNEQRQRIWPNMPDELRPPKKKTPPPPPR